MCICGNNKTFNECCKKIISHQQNPLNAEELMRSRYSAYVQSNGAYLVYSTIKENQHTNDIALIEEFSRCVEWLKLDVLSASQWQVEFKAYYRDNEDIKVLHEKSNFVLENNIFKYKDGLLYNSKVQRNETCPCGSDKKFKRCCSS